MPLDPNAIRAQFPIFAGNDLVYLDSAASSQKPQAVLDAMNRFYATNYGNVNRGVHRLAEAATIAYDDARKKVKEWIGAEKSHEIIFVRNATEAINLVARSWGDEYIKEKDAILLSILEHHSNIVPWQQLAARKKATIDWVGINEIGELRMDELKEKLAARSSRLRGASPRRAQLVAVTAVSNVLGTITPLKEMIRLAHDAGALVLVDAAQLAPHARIDVVDLDADFLVFSGHKMYGPTGIGVLYAKEKLLEKMPPFLGGGDMIGNVTREGFTTAELPRKFEAGTPAIAEAVGLAAAIDWMESIGIEDIAHHEKDILAYAMEKFNQQRGPSQPVTLLGPKDPSRISGCISFTIDGIHPHDLTQFLSDRNIMLRAGHHCTQPLHAHLGIAASTRLSVAAYNTKEDIDRCVEGIDEAIRKFS